MFIDSHFIYDGVSSLDYDLYLVKMSGGMFETRFGAEQDIVEETVTGHDIPHFYRTKKSPLEFELYFAKSTPWTEQNKQDIVNWLYQGEYKTFQTSDNLNVVYYCMPVGAASRFDTGTSEGYIKIKLRCNAPYGYSYPETIQSFDLSANPGTMDISMLNGSNIEKWVMPEIEIEAIDGGTIQLSNDTDSERPFIINNLQMGETVYFDNLKKRIETDVPSIYRLSDFNKNWLRLLQGENIITVTGKCNIYLRVQYPLSL